MVWIELVKDHRNRGSSKEPIWRCLMRMCFDSLGAVELVVAWGGFQIELSQPRWIGKCGHPPPSLPISKKESNLERYCSMNSEAQGNGMPDKSWFCLFDKVSSVTLGARQSSHVILPGDHFGLILMYGKGDFPLPSHLSGF